MTIPLILGTRTQRELFKGHSGIFYSNNYAFHKPINNTTQDSEL